MTSEAYWQVRILDLSQCIAATALCGDVEIAFNLTLSDPIAGYCDPARWHGVAGDYTVVLGSESHASEGHSAGLPHLSSSVSSFSRLWFGAADARTLAFSGEIEAPESLVSQLDRCWRIPQPHLDWPF